MEVLVSGSEGLNNEHILQLRAGVTRRQSKLSTGLPFHFPLLPQSSAPLKVDVFQRVCSRNIALSPDADQYVVHVPALEEGGSDSKLRFLIKDGNAVKEESGQQEVDEATDPVSPPTGRRAEAAAEARAYLQQNKLTSYIQEMVASMLQERPDDPFGFMAEYARRESEESTIPAQESKPPPLLPKPPSTAPPADKPLNARAKNYIAAGGKVDQALESDGGRANVTSEGNRNGEIKPEEHVDVASPTEIEQLCAASAQMQQEIEKLRSVVSIYESVGDSSIADASHLLSAAKSNVVDACAVARRHSESGSTLGKPSCLGDNSCERLRESNAQLRDHHERLLTEFNSLTNAREEMQVMLLQVCYGLEHIATDIRTTVVELQHPPEMSACLQSENGKLQDANRELEEANAQLRLENSRLQSELQMRSSS
eukprot:TRINITY_DN26023_c0_g3_i1.p1 TRINITY_DN26023_c0_g3~~TRINITY_DN26023_c0_g3_i1.p1  ORF type:complete len:426 (+),score=65.15 TRINITY_DN26023_c0_g3_i1:151-1428(+)